MSGSAGRGKGRLGAVTTKNIATRFLRVRTPMHVAYIRVICDLLVRLVCVCVYRVLADSGRKASCPARGSAAAAAVQQGHSHARAAGRSRFAGTSC